MAQTQQFSIGYENGAGGYNTLSYLNITNVDKNGVKVIITVEKNDKNGTFEEVIYKNTVIKTKSDDIEYPFMILTLNNEQLHRKKYYYENISIIIIGNCTVEKQTEMHVDR